MNLKELAAINGISISTAKRYKRDGVDLTDAQAVNAYKHTQRTRFGLSKLAHRAKGMHKAVVSDRVEELESVICDCHFIAQRVRNRNPLVTSDMESILQETTPIIETIATRA